MEVQEILSNARSTLTTRTVFADPIEKNGLTVIPAAKVLVVVAVVAVKTKAARAATVAASA